MCATLRSRRLRAVYAGRFVRRKGLHDAFTAIRLARDAGVPVEYHLFGNGPEETNLRALAAELDLHDLVTFHGFVDYTPEFIGRLAEFDMHLFTPTEEDTPRALFDTLAAGLPLVGTAIPFLRTRVERDAIGALGPVGDPAAAAAALCTVAAAPERLAALSRVAREAGLRHSVDAWYRRRAQWTREYCG